MNARLIRALIALVLGFCPIVVVSASADEEPLPFVKGSQTLVVFPDTEGYAGRRPHVLNAMTQWVADQQEARNILGLLHVGDVTNNNAKHEWENVRKAFDTIEGVVPYILAAGNHDYDHTPGRLTRMNDYFKVEDLERWPSFGGVFEEGKLENHYQFIELHGREWIVLSLEMGPRQAVVEWANEVLAEHEDRPAIILTHGYLYYGNARYNHLLGKQRASPYNFYGDGMDGEMLWDALVRKQPNVMMVVCGHLSSQYVGYRKDEGDYGNIVHQMLVDYEKMRGGYGFLRLLEFLPDGKTVQVRTYSPVTKKVRSPITRGDDPMHPPELEEFRFTLQPATRDEPKPVAATPAEPLSAPPSHRYSFAKTGGDGTVLIDTIGGEHGVLRAEESNAALDGKGRLVLDEKAVAELSPDVFPDGPDMTLELWFAATGEEYGWTPAVRFSGAGGGDWLTYTFRTRTTHRAEVALGGDNRDIQRHVPVEQGKTMHIVMTYDGDGGDGEPLLSYYRDGVCYGRMATRIDLEKLTIEKGQIGGGFAGIFDELRIYDRSLSDGQVAGNYNEGPDVLNLAKGVTAPRAFSPLADVRAPAWARQVMPLRRKPTHRYSFDGEGGHEATLTDTIGKADGTIHAPDGGARLNGEGRLVIDDNDGALGKLDPLVVGLDEASIEAWVIPTRDSYQWDPVFRFGGPGDDWVWYCFRNLRTHRTELCDAGHNEDIQNKGMPVKPGEPIHVVWVYERGDDGKPVLRSYFNGEPRGRMPTSIDLSELNITEGRVGPFAGEFDELRVYDFALDDKEVKGNYEAGPDELVVAK